MEGADQSRSALDCADMPGLFGAQGRHTFPMHDRRVAKLQGI